MNGKPACSCPAYKYRGQNCKHLKAYSSPAEDVFGTKFKTPQEKAIEKSKAAKLGKAIAPLVSKNPAYKSSEAKVEADAGLKEFLDQVSCPSEKK